MDNKSLTKFVSLFFDNIFILYPFYNVAAVLLIQWKKDKANKHFLP